jgi:hypothetical protein
LSPISILSDLMSWRATVVMPTAETVDSRIRLVGLRRIRAVTSKPHCARLELRLT